MRLIDADKAKGYVDLCLCGVGGEMGEALRPVYKWVKKLIDSVPTAEPQESDHKCHSCKHYTSGERDGSCGSYICKHYSDWESEEV